MLCRSHLKALSFERTHKKQEEVCFSERLIRGSLQLSLLVFVKITHLTRLRAEQ